MRAVRDIMGMPWTLDIRDRHGEPAMAAEVFTELERIDACYSPFKERSVISRLARGELAERDAPPEVRMVLALCRTYERHTGGYFNAWAGGRLDPCGLVKGWAADRACEILDRLGCRNYTIDAAGDVVVRGHRGDGTPWRIGIRHPVERDRVVRVVEGTDLAVATSGTYERGSHIYDPHVGRPVGDLLSMTVIGPDIVEADVLATAAFAMGRRGLELIESMPHLEAYSIDAGLQGTWTSGFAAWCA
jgi:thiamine biosynthesis lipoprotein